MSKASMPAKAGAIATAHANIALTKYWGKLDGTERLPAVPSLSMTLAALTTRTFVQFSPGLDEDVVELDGRSAAPKARSRVSELLDLVRGEAAFSHRAVVRSTNDFPTASGLASSASGFAALAVGALAAAGLEAEPSRCSELARRGSISAARSVHGGFVALDAGEHCARPVAVHNAPLRMVIAITERGAKAVGSSEGMVLTQATSPFYLPWLELSRKLTARAEAALLRGDYAELGGCMERSTMAMHATMLGAEPPLLYWNPTTLAAIQCAARLRESGVPAHCTMDAGPHVKVLTLEQSLLRVRDALAQVPGVLQVLCSDVGGPARVELL
jgi:diphosphomevalonate decarboxylase